MALRPYRCERFRRIDVGQRRGAGERHFGHGLGIAADQVARADVAFDRHEIGEEAARPHHRIAALAVDGRHHDERAVVGIEGADQAVDQGCIDLRHVAETDDGAVGLRRQRGDAGFERGAEPVGEMRIVHEFDRQAGERRLDLVALMPGDDDHRPRPRGEHRVDHDADQRLAADLGQQFVRPAHAARAAGGEHDGGDGAAFFRHRLGARLRPGDDLHQQAADAEAGDVLARHRQAGEEPHQHPVKTVLLGAARAARRAEHRAAVGVADHQQITGIDRHAEMLDMAADRFERRGDHVAAIGDGRGAEHDGQFRAGLEHFVERARQRRALVRHAPLGNDGGAGRRQALGGDL